MMTREDVERYLATHLNPLPRGARVVGAPAVVAQMLLTSAADAERLLKGASLGLAPADPVWYIELRGTFDGAQMPHPSLPPGVHRARMLRDTAVLVLDATTGRELVRGL
jgi:hypothetical protein